MAGAHVKFRIAVCIGGGLLLFAPITVADPAPQYSPGDFVGAILAGPKPCPQGQSQGSCEANAKTRRWSLEPPTTPLRGPSPPAAAVGARKFPGPGQHARAMPTAPPRLSAANVLVTFASGSADITAQGKANLRSIAAGLNGDSLAMVNFEIAGYTDASGNDIDNFFLAGRRADAVRDYLVGQGVRSDRLQTAGYGSAHLADPSDPGSELNRRVELHRLN